MLILCLTPFYGLWVPLTSSYLSYYDHYFETEVDISQINGILTGNTVLADSALASRAQLVDFSEYGAEYKKFVVWSDIVPQILEHYSASNMSLVLDDNDRKQINQLILEDKDPGFRSITFQVEEFFAAKALDLYHHPGV